MKVKLAEALLRRKELGLKVVQLQQVKDSAVCQVAVKRVNVTDSIDDVTARVPKFHVAELLAEYDWHARQLRLVDAAIQQANWTTDVEVADSVMANFVPPDLPAVR